MFLQAATPKYGDKKQRVCQEVMVPGSLFISLKIKVFRSSSSFPNLEFSGEKADRRTHSLGIKLSENSV